MQQYKHYSFDLWGTLIQSNPDFKLKRIDYFFERFNPGKISKEAVGATFTDISQMCNSVNECTGLNIDSFEMYTMVLHRLGYPLDKLHRRDIQALFHLMATLFDNHSPHLYNSDVYKTLMELKHRGATISLLSNTAFARGTMLNKVLWKLGIGQFFDLQLFSDQVGYAKPSPELYAMMLSAVANLKAHDPCSKHEIIHVGDSYKADVQGAISAGIQAYQVHTNKNSLLDLL